MNKLNNKEEKIKDILGGLEIDIDTNDLWGNIEAELPQVKKKRRFGFFFFTGLIGLGLVGLTWIMISSNHEESSIQNITTQTNTTPNKVYASSENLISNNNHTTLDNKSQKSEDNVTITAEAVSNHLESISTTTSQSTLSYPENNSNIKIAQNPQEETPANVISEVNNSTSNTVTSYTPTLTPLATPITKNEVTHSNAKEERSAIAEISTTPTLSSKLLDITHRQKIETSPKEIKPLQAFGRQLILQFKLGANQNNTSISNINSISEFDVSEFDFETDRLGLSGSFAVGVENKGWRFLAGMAYHQNVSQYERNDVVIYKDIVTGIESYRISTDGDQSAQTGLTTVTMARDNEISFYRQHRAIDFYASIGKRLWSYKGLVLLADAGFGINTFTDSNGYYIDDKAFGFTKISDDNHPYRINTHWNAIASIELGYDFGKTRVGISPFLRYNPNSITEQTHFYQLKNSQVGMQLSLTYSPTRE